jgi:Na+-driven multidrug efflux pump
MKEKAVAVDMTKGPLFKKIIVFFLPLMLTNWLQMAFNAADKAVVGIFAGSHALGAVGAASPLTMFLVSLSAGICAGVSVISANNYGAGDIDGFRQTVKTAMTSSVLIGANLAIIGAALTKPMLLLLGTPEDILTDSVRYLVIFFSSMPGLLCYSFSAALLRSIGDTKRPLYILLAAGLMNVILNVIFVVAFHLDAVGGRHL